MPGGISWDNVCRNPAASISAMSDAYDGSEPERAVSDHLSEKYLFDTGDVAPTGDYVWSCTIPDVSVRVMGIAGIVADSSEDLQQLDLALHCNLDSVFQFNTLFSPTDNAGWVGVDQPESSLVWTVSAPFVVDSVFLRIRRRDAAAWVGDWIGIGMIWAGPGIRWGVSPGPYLAGNYDVRRIDNDEVVLSRGRQLYADLGVEARQIPINIERAYGIGQLDRTNTTLGGLASHGTGSPLAACVRSGISSVSFYGRWASSPSINRGRGDYFELAGTVEELG